MQSARLSGKVRVEVVHETGELKSAVDAQQEVVVIRKEDKRMDLDWIESLGARQDPNRDGFQLSRGLEQEATLHGAAGHLNQSAAFRNESNSSCHALYDAIHPRDLAESDGTSC